MFSHRAYYQVKNDWRRLRHGVAAFLKPIAMRLHPGARANIKRQTPWETIESLQQDPHIWVSFSEKIKCWRGGVVLHRHVFVYMFSFKGEK